MKNMKWIQVEKRHHLMSNDELLTDLLVKPGGTSLFSINDQNYSIKQGGIWQPVYTVYAEDRELLKLTHSFWGSHGKIIFNDGTNYVTSYSTKKGFTIRIMDGENEILCYKKSLQQSVPYQRFTTGTAIVDAEKLTVLAALAKTIMVSMFSDGDDMTSSLIVLCSA